MEQTGIVLVDSLFKPLGVCAGAVLSVFGIVKTVAAVLGMIRERRDAARKETEAQLTAIRTELAEIGQMQKRNADAIASLQCECLNRVFVEYVENQRPCAIQIKQSIAAMYEAYRLDRTHNHVAKDYLERLMALPTA